MFGVMARLLKRLTAATASLGGRIAFRLGRHATARRAFERVLRLGGDEFTAYVHLGRIALGEGDFSGYRREMSNARAVDPERFSKLRPAAEGVEARFVGSPFEETGERATWRSVRPGNHGIARRSTVRSAEVPTENLEDLQQFGPLFELPQTELGQQEPGVYSDGGHTGRAADAPRRHRRDDFLSINERDRFRSLPPLRQDDVRTADYEELARRLGG